MASTNPQVSLVPAGDIPQVPIDIGNVQPMLTPDQLNERALKAHYGLGGITGNTYEDYQSAFFTGNSQGMRKANSAQLNLINSQQQQQKLQDMAVAKGSALTVDEVRDALTQKAPPSDPNSVFEDGYGTQFINALDNANQNLKGSFMDSAYLTAPAQVDAVKSAGSQTVAWRNYVGNTVQDLNAQLESQPWYQKAAYGAFQLTPFLYSSFQDTMLRAGHPEAGMLGDYLSSQADNLWRMPYDQRKVAFDSRINELKRTDPHLALQFANAVLGQSTSDKITNDLFAPLDFVPFLGGMTKDAASLLLKRGQAINDARNAVKTSVEAEAVANPAMPPDAKAANAAGDVNEAAKQRIVDQTVQKFEGSNNPAEEARAFLPTALRTDWNAVESNAGNLSREQMARLKQDYVDSETNILDSYNNSLRPQRTEIQRASREQLDLIAANTRDKFPGDAVADISDPVYNPIANTWSQDLKIVNSDGGLFADRDAVKNYAAAKGYKDFDIGEDTGRVSSAPTGSPSDIRRKAQIEKNAEGYRTAIKNFKDQAKDKTLQPDVRKEARQNAKDLQETYGKHQEELAAINRRLQPVTIDQQGVGFYLRHTVNINEHDSVIRGLYQTVPGSTSVVNKGGIAEQWRNAATGKIRIADDSLSPNENANRKITTYAQNNFTQHMIDEAKFIRDVREGRVRFDPVTGEDISDLKSGIKALANGVNPLNGNKKIADEFNEVLDYGRKAWNEETNKPGYFFKNPGELQTHYLGQYNRLPTFAETRAYFAYTRALAYDWVQRNLAEYKFKARLGVKSHTFSYMDANGQTITSPKFDAAVQGHLPGGEDGVLIVNSSGGKPLVTKSNSMAPHLRKELDAAVKTGKTKVLRVYAAERRPLSGVGPISDERIRYVIADNIGTENLNYTQIPRQEGGHFDYAYKRWLKQPDIREETIGNSVTHWMEPDRTVMALPEGTTGELIKQSLNKVRTALKNGDEAAAEAAAKQHFPEDWEKVKSWFSDQRDENGKVTRRALSLDHDFYVVNTNKRIIDGHDLESLYKDKNGNSTFRDGTRSGSDALQFQTRYTQERDAEGLFEGINSGTVNDPIFKFEPAKFIDPVPSMNRALQNIISSSFMDDSKIYSIENWLQENKRWLSSKQQELVDSAPVHSFLTALENLKTDTPFVVRQNLTNNWKKIRDFHGIPNAVDRALTAANQTIEDAMAAGGAIKKTALFPAWLLSDSRVAKQPIRWMRTMAYHTKLGLFATQQLFVNTMTFTLMAPLAPKSFTAGIHGALLHAWSGINADKNILKSLDEKAFSLNIPGITHGWRAGWWQEARQELLSSGFAHVGGEYVDLNDQLATNFIGNRAKDLAHMGTVFFRKTEQFVRLGAYYTAFNEFRNTVKPIGELTIADKADILRRADDLALNMSRASNSVWTSGIGAIPLQFFNYTKHAAELFWGKRMGDTTMERSLARARLIIFNSLLFGVPTGLSVTGIPVQSIMRKVGIDQGYNPGENTAWSTFMEGFPALAAALITGKGDAHKGNWYNIGARYGMGGMTQILEALSSDKAWYSLLGGPSFSIIQNTLEAAHPFFAWIGAAMQGKSPPGVKGEDVIEAGREISSVNQAHRLYMALSTGQWFNKTGSSLGAVSPANAAFMAVTGLDPAAAGDVYIKNTIKSDEVSAQKTAMKYALSDWRKGLWAAYRDDPDNAKFYRNRALSTLQAANYPIEKYNSFYTIANKGYESLIDSTNQRFYLNNNPMDKRQQRVDQFRNLSHSKGQ